MVQEGPLKIILLEVPIKEKESYYKRLLEIYNKSKSQRSKILKKAKEEQTDWENAIELFNQRFIVPFTLVLKNRTEMMLGIVEIPELGYEFHDGDEKKSVARDELLEALSQGERKAFYILNVIFEIEARRQSDEETLIVIDDIADSFDYLNKYAIIQYLKEISTDQKFKLIILTHNFDFFRTVNRRFVPYKNCLMATKLTNKSIELQKAKGIRNPFLLDWKESLFDDKTKRVASISFARNLIEHIKGDSSSDYKKLTSLLHWKNDTKDIKQKDLDDIYINLFGQKKSYSDECEPVVDMILSEARNCQNLSGGINLENKIVLSIAIRLLAEKFMIIKLDESDLLDSITSNQTHILLDKFEQKFPNEENKIKTLRDVALMTPENIHLNSFMYEPIIDMSEDSLTSLYSKIANLNR